jgi:hypothetical protein
MSTDNDFHEVAFETFVKAQWGNFYDQELIDVLTRLHDAEGAARFDFEALHSRIESVELRQKFGDRETALAELQAARDEFWKVKDRISSERDGYDAFGIIALHSARLAEWGKSFEDATPEVTIVAWLSLLLFEVDGEVPGTRLIYEVIDALKAMSPLFDEATTNEEKKQLWAGGSTIPVRKLIELWAKRRHPDDPTKWVKVCKTIIRDTAKYIHDENLFARGETRVDKILKDDPLLPLLQTLGSSRSFFGR